MAGLEQLQQAFLAADNAGNVEDATMFASEISRLTSATPAPTTQVDITQPMAQAQPMQGEAQPQQDQGFLTGIQEQITGTQRATPETEAMGDWASMPEMNTFSMASFKSALGTMLTNPEETVQVIKANYPGVQVRQDESGNYLLRSSIDGQEYAIKPGFQPSDIPRAAGAMLAFTPAGRATSIGGAALGAGLTQAGIEASQAATGGEFDPKEVALAGALGGAGKVLEKGVTTAKGLFTPPGAASETIKTAESFGVSPMTTDVIPPTTFAGKVGQSITERIPVAGTGPVRAAQQVKRIEAVRNVLRDFGATDAAQATDDVMADVLKKRSKDLTKYIGLKNDVIDKLADAGAVSVNNTVRKIDDEIAQLNSLRTAAVEPVIKILDDYKGAFQGQNIKNVETLRKQLGDQLKAPDMASVRTNAEKAVSSIYRAVNEDMGNFIKQAGDRRDFTKWKVGNAKLSQMIGDLKVGTLKSILAKGDATPELVRKMIFSQKPSDMKLLYKSLSPAGRANARTAILQEAASKAGGAENISPDIFKNQLNRLSKSTGVFFTGQDKKVVDGLIKTLELTRSAGTAAAKPPTGAELTTFAAPSVLTWVLGGSPVAGLGATAALGGAARVYESAPVRNLLIKIASAAPGKSEQLIQELTKVMQAQRISNKEEQ